jgi:polysaccharide export outer membrane protein
MADLENVMLFRLSPEGKPDNKKYNLDLIRKGEADDPLLQSDDVVVVNRDSNRVWLRDSLFRDVIDTLNPFSNTYRSAVGTN